MGWLVSYAYDLLNSFLANNSFLGQCKNCQLNTEGFHCESCKTGFYGSAKEHTCKGNTFWLNQFRNALTNNNNNNNSVYLQQIWNCKKHCERMW
jgi:hypothetical protein